MRSLLVTLGRKWCELMHANTISHPVCGHYRCWRCQREYAVAWERPGEVRP